MKTFIALASGALALALVAPKTQAQQDQPGNEAATAAIQAIEQAGGSVRRIAQNDERFEVDFHLTGPSVTDGHLKHLKDLPNVVHLHLGNTAVGDAGLAHLQDLTTLTRLHLERTKITDAGLKYLRGLKNLEYLNLYGAPVSDEGLRHLEDLSRLRNLYLWQTHVTEAGVQRLKKALPNVDINTGWDVQEPNPETPKEDSPAQNKNK